MSLSESSLTDMFRKIMDPEHPEYQLPETTDEAREAWADIYDTYAQNAEDVSGDAVTVTNRAGFKAALVFTSSTDPSAAGVVASEFANAFLAYWTGGVFAVGTPPSPGAVCTSVGGNLVWGVEASSLVTVVNPAILQASLTTEFGKNTVDGKVKSEDLAAIFHAATTGDISVLITGLDTTAPTPLPITNTCTVF